MVSQITEMTETGPKYRAIAPEPLPALDKPYKELTQEERNDRAAAAFDFKIERVRRRSSTLDENDYDELQGGDQDVTQANGHDEQTKELAEGHVNHSTQEQ